MHSASQVSNFYLTWDFKSLVVLSNTGSMSPLLPKEDMMGNFHGSYNFRDCIV